MNDADSTLEMLQNFLSGPDAKEKISQALDIMGNGNLLNGAFSDSAAPSSKSDTPLPDIDPQKLLNIMSALKKYENTPDPRCDLLRALKPYLGKDKNIRAEKAIKIASVLKYAPMLETLKDLF